MVVVGLTPCGDIMCKFLRCGLHAADAQLTFAVKMSLIKHMVRGTVLDDAPWSWKDAWHSDMPPFFSEVACKQCNTFHVFCRLSFSLCTCVLKIPSTCSSQRLPLLSSNIGGTCLFKTVVLCFFLPVILVARVVVPICLQSSN